MEEIKFKSCKIVENSTNRIIGIIDFKVEDESYLSLLMIDKKLQGTGIGKIIFNEFEKYAKSLNSKSIKIDVVTEYDENVLNFWINNGFIKLKDIELNWSGKILHAVQLIKKIA